MGCFLFKTVSVIEGFGITSLRDSALVISEFFFSPIPGFRIGLVLSESAVAACLRYEIARVDT